MRAANAIAFRGVLIAIFVWAARDSGAASAFPLVNDQTQAVIVTGAQSKGERLAWRYVGDYPPRPIPTTAQAYAEQLRDSIKDSTGRTLQIVAEGVYKPETDGPAIYLGATNRTRELFRDRLRDMDSDGYVIHVTPTFVILAGNMQYVVYDFLSSYLGIDQYIPNELFSIAPRHERVIIRPESRVEVPAFLSRCLNTYRDGRTWRLHAGNGRYDFHHYIGQRFMLASQFPDNPEYFGLWQGKRVPCVGSSTPNPCVLNPDVIDIVTEHCRERFDKQPNRLSASLGMNDSYKYCQCERCKPLQGRTHSIKIEGKTTHASDYWYTFLNEVARRVHETHPDRFIGTLAYCRTEHPPNFPVQRNILPFICDSSGAWGNPAEREHDLGQVDAWLERVDRIGLYEYLYGRGYSIPRIYTRHLAEKLKHVAEKCPGSGFYAEVQYGRGFDGPKLWITERLLWAPTQDPGQLLSRWCRACFGPAAEPMKAYFEAVEQDYAEGAARVKASGNMYGYRRESQFDLMLPEDFPPLWKLLDQAQTKAAGDTLTRKRIDYFASCLTVSETVVRRHHAHAAAAELMKAKAPPADVLTALLEGEKDWPRTELWRHVFQLQRKDARQIGSIVASSRAIELMEYVLGGSVRQEIEQLLGQGERNAGRLRDAAGKAVDKLAAHVRREGPAAEKRLATLRNASQRIVGANRADTPPVIDGGLDDACWQWKSKQTWFVRNSALPFPYATDVAFAYDDNYLYVALRCGDQSQDSYDDYLKQHGDKARARGFRSANQTPSVEVYLDFADRPGGQLIVNVYGGLLEKGIEAVASHKTVWDPGANEWQTEMAVSWEKINVDPAGAPYFRLNLVRYARNQWGRNVGSWTLARETRHWRGAQKNERGWLVLE